MTMKLDLLNLPQQTLACGMLRRLGLEHHAHASHDDSEQVRNLRYEVAGKYKHHTLADFCREILLLEGVTFRLGRADYREVRDADDPREYGDTREIVRSALSTASAGAIFSVVANAAMVDGFTAAPDSSEGWTSTTEVPNFKTIERHSIEVGKLSKLGRGADHARDVQVEAGLGETYKVARYAATFTIDEQELIDDRLDALTRVPREMGAAARELKADLVCSILLANAALGADSIALFHADHNNTDTGAGSALSATSLGTGVQRIGAQRILGRALNLKSTHLIVPANLYVAARELLRTLDRDDRQNLLLRSDDRLGVAGVTDPVTGQAYAGTTTNWWLATKGQRTIEVATLPGGQLPSIREYALDIGQYGMGFAVKWDIGAKTLDFRGLYQSAGA